MRRNLTMFAFLAILLASPFVGAQTNTLRFTHDAPLDPPMLVPPASLAATVVVDNVDTLQGWSFGVCNDEAFLLVDAAEESALVMTLNDGAAVAFLDLQTPAGGVTMGVVIDLFGMQNLAPGVGQELLLIDYSTTPGLMQPTAPPPLMTTIAFCDTLGAVPVSTVLVVNGLSVDPDLENLTVLIPPPPEPGTCDFFCDAGPDDVSISWSNCTDPATGVADYYLLFRDGVLLMLFDDGTQSFLDSALAPGTYHYDLIAVNFVTPGDPPDTLTVSCDANVIPVTLTDVTPTVGLYQGGTMLTLTGTGFTADVTTVDIGSQTALDIVVVDDNTITCTTPAVDFVGLVDVGISNSFGSETITDAFLYGFVRGMANNDTLVDIADPVFILDWLFGGGPEPFCLSAADANDSGVLDIADPVYLLTYLFAMTPAPPAPFAVPGLDPTPDALTCGNPPPAP